MGEFWEWEKADVVKWSEKYFKDIKKLEDRYRASHPCVDCGATGFYLKGHNRYKECNGAYYCWSCNGRGFELDSSTFGKETPPSLKQFKREVRQIRRKYD